MLRGSRLKVTDEIANGLSYYDYTFLRELPRFYAALEDQFVSTDRAWDNFELPSFLRVARPSASCPAQTRNPFARHMQRSICHTTQSPR